MALDYQFELEAEIERLKIKLEKIKACVEKHSVNNHDPYHANLTELVDELDDILKGD